MAPTGENTISCQDFDPKLLYGEKYRENLLRGLEL